MKTKAIAIIFILLIFAFPFRYAVLDQTNSQVINLLCMIATVIGTLIFMLTTLTDGKKPEEQAKPAHKPVEETIKKKAA